MVRRRTCAVSNHEARGHPSRRLLCKLLRMGSVFPAMRSFSKDEEIASLQRIDRVQVSLPQSMPTQPSTLNVSGPDTEMLLA